MTTVESDQIAALDDPTIFAKGTILCLIRRRGRRTLSDLHARAHIGKITGFGQDARTGVYANAVQRWCCDTKRVRPEMHS
jgi:hypothetical protein